jgi:membrane fusion protein (multidrug efflux system)
MSIRPSTLLPAAVPAVAPSPPPASVTPPDARSAPAGGTLRRLAIPLLVLVLVAGLSAAAIVNWDRWTSTAAVQATDNAYVRAETTRLSTRVAGAVRRVAAAVTSLCARTWSEIACSERWRVPKLVRTSSS